MAGIDAHPAVKAISPQAPMTDVWMGDDFFHNGAFRESYGFDYVQQMEAQKTDVRVDCEAGHVRLLSAARELCGAGGGGGDERLPTAKAFLTQPAYTKFWQEMAVENHLAGVEVPTLEVGGYWDQEDMWGTQAEYAALKQHDAKRGLSGAGAVEPRWLAWALAARWDRTFGTAGLRRTDGDGVPQDDGGAVLREVPEGQAGVRSGRYGELSYRARISGSGTARGLRRRGLRRRGFIWSREEAQLCGAGRGTGMRSRRRMWPIRRIRFRIGIGRSSRRMRRARSGTRGWWRTSAL
jgi:hypothetical protein